MFNPKQLENQIHNTEEKKKPKLSKLTTKPSRGDLPMTELLCVNF